ncbi:hypothetical protein ACGFNX_41825 [Streptomyces sp. NPDC048723]|uniref:hypothetical protein n=1 Tax=Streptomyces sp. NPDC048723 TaxID=3365589 RepID=UPI0037235C73
MPCASQGPAPPAGPGPLPAGADRERSLRLLKAIDEAGANGTGMAGEWSESERIVLHSVAVLPCRQYAPPGHGYRACEGGATRARARG